MQGILTKLMNRNRRCSTFDDGGRLEVEDGEIVADVNFTGVCNHPETTLGVEVTVT